MKFEKYPTKGHGRLPRWLSGKESACKAEDAANSGFDPWVRKIPWGRKWQPAPGFMPGESHGRRSLAGYSPRGAESDTTETTEHTHASLISHLSSQQPRLRLEPSSATGHCATRWRGRGGHLTSPSVKQEDLTGGDF